MLSRQTLLPLEPHPSLFCFSYFWGRVIHLCWACLTLSSPVYASHIPDITGSCHHAQLLIDWEGPQELFLGGWPWTTIFLISTSWVTRITDVIHLTWLSWLFHWVLWRPAIKHIACSSFPKGECNPILADCSGLHLQPTEHVGFHFQLPSTRAYLAHRKSDRAKLKAAPHWLSLAWGSHLVTGNTHEVFALLTLRQQSYPKSQPPFRDQSHSSQPLDFSDIAHICLLNETWGISLMSLSWGLI
jgi:hypothetical protein